MDYVTLGIFVMGKICTEDIRAEGIDFEESRVGVRPNETRTGVGPLKRTLRRGGEAEKRAMPNGITLCFCHGSPNGTRTRVAGVRGR